MAGKIKGAVTCRVDGHRKWWRLILTFMLSGPAVHGACRRFHWRRVILLSLLIQVLSATAGDWSQYRGPTHDGVSTDRIVKQWSGAVTNPVWRVPVVNGLGRFAVGAGCAGTQGRRTIHSGDKGGC